MKTLGDQYQGKSGVNRIYEWGAGKYDVVVTIGASYVTRRQEAAAWQMDLMKVLPPQMAAAMAPLAVKNLDGPGNREISERLNATLPPKLQGDKEEPQLPPEVRQRLEQAQQMIQQLSQRVSQLSGSIEMDEVKANKDLTRTRESDQTKERVARIAAETEIARTRMELIKELMKMDADGSQLLAQEETKRLLKLADLEVSSQMAPMPRTPSPSPQRPPQQSPQRPPQRPRPPRPGMARPPRPPQR